MRLIVARCEVRYSRTPERAAARGAAADHGQGRRHVHGLGRRRRLVKPLNWMTPPTVIEESPTAGWSCASAPGATRTGSRSRSPRCCPTSTHDMGSPDEDAALAKDGVEAHLQELLAEQPRLVRRGASAGAARVADRHRPGRPDVPRRRGASGWRSRSSGWPGSRRSSSSPATSSGSGSTRRSPRAAACSPRRRSSRRRGCSRRARGIECVEVDLAVLRGEREPDLRLFAA